MDRVTKAVHSLVTQHTAHLFCESSPIVSQLYYVYSHFKKQEFTSSLLNKITMNIEIKSAIKVLEENFLL